MQRKCSIDRGYCIMPHGTASLEHALKAHVRGHGVGADNNGHRGLVLRLGQFTCYTTKKKGYH